MSHSRQPWFAWPGWAHFRLALGLGALLTAWFVLIYGGCDLITGWRVYRVPVHFAFEAAIPFVPSMTLVYMSIYVPMWLAPFVLRRRSEIVALNGAMGVAILVAGACFLCVPAELAYPTHEDLTGPWAGLYHFARTLALRYNLLPSLHVTLSSLCLAAIARPVRWPLRLALGAWALLIAASTLLTHSHHVLDVVGGFVLAGVCYGAVYLRWAGVRPEPWMGATSPGELPSSAHGSGGT